MNGTATPGGLRVVRLIAGRELRERLRAKSFLLFTAALVVVIVAIGLIARIAGGGDPEPVQIGVTEPVPSGFVAAVEQVAAVFEREAEVSAVATPDAARQAVEDDDLDAAVIGAERQLVFAEDVDGEIEAIVGQAWSGAQLQDAMVAAGMTPEQVADALAGDPLDVVTLDEDDAPDEIAMLTGTLAAILLFIAIQTFGNYVLVGVTEEKSTAVVELLLARVSADQLLAGKVIGIGIAGLIQFVAAIAAGVVSLTISGTDVPDEIWSALPMTIVWFLGGYALYSTVFALAGSLVSRQEDAQAAAAPISTVLIGAYLLVFIFGYVPDSTASTVMSLIPPLAPLLMPMRMAAGAAPLWQVAVSLVLLLVTIVLVWKLAAKVYEQVLLRRGSRISWKEVLSLARRKGASA